MAKDTKQAEQAGDTEAPKKSKKLLIIIVAAVVLLLGVGGTAAYFLMHKDAESADDEEVVAEKSDKKKKGDKDVLPTYVPFDAFTVNLVAEEAGDQFLQLTISVEVADPHLGDRLKTYMPKLRNSVMLLLSGKKASELVTKEGKEKLATEIRDQMNGIVDAPAAKGKSSHGAIKEVLFTSFIIQ